MGKQNMYAATKTWNPFKGCEFDCTYCVPSFKAQAKRQKHNCDECYHYVPHEHPERLTKFPSEEIIFVSGNGDLSFSDPGYTRRIIAAVEEHGKRWPHKTFYFQSKRPEYFAQFTKEFPESVILLTTLETNRDSDYTEVSKAPLPSERYRQFKVLDYPRKVVTIEPVMDFDIVTFTKWVKSIKPEHVWLGYNSKKMKESLPEPSAVKLKDFAGRLKDAGIEVRGKTMRGVQI